MTSMWMIKKNGLFTSKAWGFASTSSDFMQYWSELTQGQLVELMTDSHASAIQEHSQNMDSYKVPEKEEKLPYSRDLYNVEVPHLSGAIYYRTLSGKLSTTYSKSAFDESALFTKGQIKRFHLEDCQLIPINKGDASPVRKTALLKTSQNGGQVATFMKETHWTSRYIPVRWAYNKFKASMLLRGEQVLVSRPQFAKQLKQYGWEKAQKRVNLNNFCEKPDNPSDYSQEAYIGQRVYCFVRQGN